MAETNQKWQKMDKNDRKIGKMWSFTNYNLPSSHFCPAKLLFLSCQDAISVMPSSHFCSAKLSKFSWRGPRPPSYTNAWYVCRMSRRIFCTFWIYLAIFCTFWIYLATLLLLVSVEVIFIYFILRKIE